MEPIVEIQRERKFSLDEARELLPVIFRMTEKASEKVQVLVRRIEVVGSQNEKTVAAMEAEINDLVQNWQNKIEKLGATPKGLWIADFDSGEGYFCWKYPEKQINYWHGYSDGFTCRVHVDSLNQSQEDAKVSVSSSYAE